MEFPRNLGAFTNLDPTYPDYISVNEEKEGKISITVRVKDPIVAEGRSPDCHHVRLEMTWDQWLDFLRDANGTVAAILRPQQDEGEAA